MVKNNYKYQFNKHTLSFEKVKTKPLKRLVVVTCILLLGYLINTMLLSNVNNISELHLQKKRTQLIAGFMGKQKQIDSLQMVLVELQSNDEVVYRAVLQKESMPPSIRLAGTGGGTPENNISAFAGNDVVAKLNAELKALSNQFEIQVKSYKELDAALRTKIDFEDRKPAIQPVSVRDLIRISSYFGHRHDPFTGKAKSHHGIDFTGKEGTPIFSTGLGVVEKVKHSNRGYGNEVIINHGFGFKTRYAHLHEIIVNEGQTVKRGDTIATMGSTGRSTGTHLHYEVIYNNRIQNPIYYFTDNLSEEEFDIMLKN